MKATINSHKHFIQFSGSVTAAASIATNTLVQAIDVIAQDYQVRVGSKIAAVYVELWMTSDDAAQGNAIITLEKVQGGAPLMTYGQAIVLHDYPNKKNILHTTMGLTGPNVQPATNLMKGWYKIPKGKQRFGLNDRFMLNIATPLNGSSYCAVVIYKEYF